MKNTIQICFKTFIVVSWTFAFFSKLSWFFWRILYMKMKADQLNCKLCKIHTIFWNFRLNCIICISGMDLQITSFLCGSDSINKIWCGADLNNISKTNRIAYDSLRLTVYTVQVPVITESYGCRLKKVPVRYRTVRYRTGTIWTASFQF
jgi:hypothetical protein